jgi:membrane protease YdiL (CAAX protease family)
MAYLKTRGLWLPIWLHWSWNFFQGPIFSSNVSGLGTEPRIFEVQTAAPNWLSGGTYGLEASAALTLTCTVAIVWLWKTRSVQTTPAMLEVSKQAESA